MAREASLLFEPVVIGGGCTARNRLVMAPMTRQQAPHGVITDEIVAYYRRRAAGGFGLILTEGSPVSVQGSPSVAVPNFFGADAVAGWGRVASAVHEEGGRIIAQLWHVGVIRGGQPMEYDRSVPTVGPSGFYPNLVDGEPRLPHHVVGETMTQADIDRTIDDFAAAAQNARAAGMDGIELHAAHGYLFDQFFWAASNRRTDRYNGSIGERTRFAVETVGEIRRRVGRDFAIGLRFSQWKLPETYDLKMLATPAELAAFLEPLADAGVDFFDASTRRYWEPEYDGSDLNLAGWTKKITGKVTMTVGSVGLSGPLEISAADLGASETAELEPLLAMLERGDFDLVGLGRASLANPDWPRKVADGRQTELRPYDASVLDSLD